MSKFEISDKAARIANEVREQSENVTVTFAGIKSETDIVAIIGTVIQCDVDSIQNIDIFNSCLTDQTGGMALAEIVEQSTSIKGLCLRSNKLTERTIEAVGRALTVNTSIKHLILTRDACASLQFIHDTLFCALRINPLRSPDSVWIVVENGDVFCKNIYPEMKKKVDQLGHPSLAFLLFHSPLLK